MGDESNNFQWWSNFSLSNQLTFDSLSSYPHPLIHIFYQNQILIRENNDLKSQKEEIIQQKEALRTQNERLHNCVAMNGDLLKRKYSQRRTWLQKKFRCHQKACNNQYSSKIALNLHLRKFHPEESQEARNK